MSALLRIEELEVTYASRSGAVPAVRGVDLAVDAGEVVGLVGESGCGKSTVAAAVLRLLPVGTEVRGRVLLNGADVLGMTWGQVRRVRWATASMSAGCNRTRGCWRMTAAALANNLEITDDRACGLQW